MTIDGTSLPGVLVITPRIHRDNRGLFFETFNKREMTKAGLPEEWAQDNFSLSTKNVLREFTIRSCSRRESWCG